MVSISSLNGIVASPTIGAYSMRKHAIEAFGDWLTAQLAPFAVRASLNEPGNVGTEVGRDTVAYPGGEIRGFLQAVPEPGGRASVPPEAH